MYYVCNSTYIFLNYFSMTPKKAKTLPRNPKKASEDKPKPMAHYLYSGYFTFYATA